MGKRLRRFVAWCRDRVRDAGASSEDDTERDGVLSHSAETHAVAHGLFDSLKSPRLTAGALPENADVQAEVHYYKGAYVVGSVLQLGVLAGLAYFGIAL